MTPCAEAHLRGLAARAAWLALGCCPVACGADEGTAEPRGEAPATFEGPNFYEPGGGPGPEPQQPAADSPPVASPVPGFVGFVGEEAALATCSAATGRDSVPADEADPSLMCRPITRASISDFPYAGGDTRGVFFGAASDVVGGTFFYPEGAGALGSDVTGNDWHLSGTVAAISGFGLYLSGCSQLDAAAYGGIEFNVWGSLGQGGSLVFFVGTAANQVAHTWINENKANPADPDEPPNLGRCIPLSNRYDGTCTEPRTAVPVAATPTTVQVPWRALTDGCPELSVNPREITAIAWYFAPSPSGPYDVDIHIDDLRFADVSPL